MTGCAENVYCAHMMFVVALSCTFVSPFVLFTFHLGEKTMHQCLLTSPSIFSVPYSPVPSPAGTETGNKQRLRNTNLHQ